MNFSSLREYFYKLANRCYVLVLLPLFVFIYLYHLLDSGKLVAIVIDDTATVPLAVGLLSLAVINLTTVHWLSLKRLARHAKETGLGNKLDRYADVVTFRVMGCAVASLLMAIGLLLTGLEWFALSYIGVMGWTVLQWPTARRACRALKLKGAEYEMVYYKKDKLL